MNEQQLKPIIEILPNRRQCLALQSYFDIFIYSMKTTVLSFPDEVFEHLRKNIYFESYTEEQLQQDLDQLVEWEFNSKKIPGK